MKVRCLGPLMPVVGPGHGLNMMKVTQLHVRIYKVTATTLDFEHDYPLQGGGSVRENG